MSEAQEAWRVWHLLQKLSDTIWEHYESAFMDIWEQEQVENDQYCESTKNDSMDTEIPF